MAVCVEKTGEKKKYVCNSEEPQPVTVAIVSRFTEKYNFNQQQTGNKGHRIFFTPDSKQERNDAEKQPDGNLSSALRSTGGYIAKDGNDEEKRCH